MKVSTVQITPEFAKELLAKNSGNRQFNEVHVRALARDMRLGKWKLNGDTICVNGEMLIDGQHRLMAVVSSGVTIETLLVEGLPSGVFNTKDIGKRRSAADTLHVGGEINCYALAAALAAIDRYETQRVGSAVRYTNMDIEELLRKHPDVRRSIRVARETKQLLRQRTLVACHYLFAKKNNDEADLFVRQLISGADLTEDDPVYVLREKLLKNSMSKAKLPDAYLMAMVIKAWNARRNGKAMLALRYIEGGPRPESFPVVL
jgi:hypothetical protein